MGKAITTLRAKYGFLDGDLPAIIVRSSSEPPQVITFSGLKTKRVTDVRGILGLQVRTLFLPQKLHLSWAITSTPALSPPRDEPRTAL